MRIERFEEIDAWKNAKILVNSVYKVCSIESFKKDYGLADQICIQLYQLWPIYQKVSQERATKSSFNFFSYPNPQPQNSKATSILPAIKTILHKMRRFKRVPPTAPLWFTWASEGAR